jgi:cellulose synthase/poly-beta-1,6-N-acetylglucosamine synthase-like glycosyltransferase
MSDWDIIIWMTCYVLVFAGLSVFGAHRLKVIYLYWKHRHDEPKVLREWDELPLITVQLPIFNELHVVERLLTAVAALEYPANKIQIQVLDDSTDETASFTEGLCQKLVAQGHNVEFRHRTNRHGFKAGALDEAMATATGEFIAIFDADFMPAPDLLMKLIHHFTDERIGLVQARWGHINRDFSLLTKLQAMFLDGHLVLEQTARSRHGEFINFNGTAGIWRTKVIAAAGGWQHDTLTEDLDLSYRAQLLGWKFIYLKDVLVPAELPPDMDSFKSQQHRWTKGSIQVCRKIFVEVWDSEESLATKLEATAHLGANFAYLLTIGTVILMWPANFMFESSWTKALLVDLPVFFFASLSVILFYLTAQGAQRSGGWWRSIPYLPALLALGIGMSINNGKAVIEALLGQESEFVRTPKYGVETQTQMRSQRHKYSVSKSVVLWIEALLALYFGFMMVMAISRGQWGSLPFLGLFGFGFAYVSGASIAKRLGINTLWVD